jgi:hypothetical protein
LHAEPFSRVKSAGPVTSICGRRTARISRTTPARPSSAKVVSKEPNPPGTAPHHADLRLRKPLALDLKQPKVEDYLQKLRDGTGVSLTCAENIQNKARVRGSVSFVGNPAWKIMDDLAAYERVQGHWEKDGDDYRLVGNPNPIPIAEKPNPDVDEKPAQPGRLALIGGGLLLSLAILCIVFYFSQRAIRRP